LNWHIAVLQHPMNSPPRRPSSATRRRPTLDNPLRRSEFGPTCAKCCWQAMRFFMWTDSAYSLNRRAFLRASAGGLGSLALAQLLNMEAHAADNNQEHPSPLAAKPPHHRPRAKSVICLFQHGGPSQMDLFDPKPE